MTIRICLNVALLLVWFVSASATAQEVGLEQILTKEEQASLGLSSMPQDRRAALSKLLIRIFRQGYASGQSKGAVQGADTAIESQVDGDFKGWEGKTVVKLMNGQIWEQTEYHYEYYYAYMPKVIIYGTGNTYKMKVDGTSRTVGVRQLR